MGALALHRPCKFATDVIECNGCRPARGYRRFLLIPTPFDWNDHEIPYTVSHPRNCRNRGFKFVRLRGRARSRLRCSSPGGCVSLVGL